MPRMFLNQYDNNLYLDVGGCWYRYDTTAYPIGEGAMGIIYHGFRCDTNEQVAVKQVRPEFWNNLLVRNRCKLESMILLNHPNIIRMIGYCEECQGSGPLYVLSEYVSGITIEEHVNTQLSRLSPRQRCEKIVKEFVQVIDAVSYLHSQGIIHRDIKPSNIMIQDGYLLKLMDLGVAKSNAFYDAHLKGSVGSIPFAAPEQLVPDDVEASVDNRSDIYSLGATLQFLLTGSFPSDLSNLSESLMRVLLTATEKDPNKRFQDVDLFKDALISTLNDLTYKPRKTFLVFVTVISALIVALMLILIL